MGRVAALSGVGLGLLALGVGRAVFWPSGAPSLDCPVEQIAFEEAHGQVLAQCVSGLAKGVAPAAAARVVGQKLDLNRLTAEELRGIPGVGATLAQRIVERRHAVGGFRTWTEVDAVEGMGPGKLAALRDVAVLSAPSELR